MGGGGGAKIRNVPTEKYIHIHVIYKRERAKSTSASETYIFAGLKILVKQLIHSMQFHFVTYGGINDSIPKKPKH